MEQAWTSVRGIAAEIWWRAITPQPAPELRTTLVLGVVALVLVALRVTWRPVRMLSTMIHEAGHAVVAVLTGRRLSGIRLHADTSGLTVSRGRPRGPGMVATLAAGYPAPAVAGVLAAVVVRAGYSAGLLWLLVAAALVMLVGIRNLYGLWVVLVVTAGLVAASWWLPTLWLSWIAQLLCWCLLLSGPRPLVELAGQRRSGGGAGSDVDQLARLTPVPGFGWLAVFWLLTVAGLVAGGWLMITRTL